MKKAVILLHMLIFLQSCGFNLEKKPYNFDNFKDTQLWDLAQAVRSDDASEVREILKDKKIQVDLKDPIYHQTLLALAIQNSKRNAFLELLKAGANPNVLLGASEDSTPLIYGIQKVKGCDLYYVETMLKHGANPNLEIKNPNPGHVFFNSFPLFVAIEHRSDYCLDLVKLLVDNGANINCCYKQSYSDFCEGVIATSLTLNDIETVRYFVIEKNITIPDTVIIIGELDKKTQEAFGLKEALNSKYFTFEDVKVDGRTYDNSKSRKIKNEILEYLNKKKQ